MWVKLDICIENRMNASACLDIWTRVMFFKFSNLHDCSLRELHKWTHNAQAIIPFFICNIINKIIKRREQKATVTKRKNKPKIVSSFTSKHKFYSNWKPSKLRKCPYCTLNCIYAFVIGQSENKIVEYIIIIFIPCHRKYSQSEYRQAVLYWLCWTVCFLRREIK